MVFGTSRVRLAALLWRQGVWEALQLQRCVVTFVLDGSGKVLAKTMKCFIVNGLIYLGSIMFHHFIISQAVGWLLRTYALPVYGPAAVAAWQRLLSLVLQLLWLLPVYCVSLMVSCIWYQQIATAAFAVQRQQQQLQQQQLQQHLPNPEQQQQQQHAEQQQLLHRPAAAAGPGTNTSLAEPGTGSIRTGAVPAAAAAAVGAAAGGGGMMQVLEGTAQEVFRVLLFLVFTLEVYVASLLPLIGPALNVLLLSWLYAYYCYDYKWSLQGARLQERLLFFEAHWAFFAGFGFPCVVATVLFPFHISAALANLLFPVFILVACSSDPAAAQQFVIDPSCPSLGSIPVFKLALHPTYWLIRRVFGQSSRGLAHVS